MRARHYSGWRLYFALVPPRFRTVIALALTLAPAAMTAAPSAAARPESAARTEAELKALRSQIERITRAASHDALEHDRASRSLRDAEVTLGGARSELSRLRAEVADREAQRARLAQQRAQQQAELTHARATLAGQLRAAYMIGQQEPLKLLLNQRDPLAGARLLNYYQYFGRARADQVAQISAALTRLDAIDADLGAEQTRLTELKTEQQEQFAQAEHARDARQKALAVVDQEAQSRSQSLARLKAQQADLEKLLAELSRSLKSVQPPDNVSAFGRLRGVLGWPVAGRLVAQFGDRRASGVRWDGLVIAAERGSPVKAVSAGRVVYADWLPGLGLLVIVDHGEGYLSLYGHNDKLYKAVGEPVSTGETIAASGDSGGRDRPELYFEIRRDGKPVDPRPWFRAAGP
jgi:septal ring factor EnvC (AmiA/AmiB activator)